MLKVYTLANCDTCRRATKWLRAKGVDFSEVPIRETPPARAELSKMLSALGGERRKLFNVSGRDYREQNLGERLPAMSADEAIALLAGNGNLVKRPFVIGDEVALVGFDENAWSAALRSVGNWRHWQGLPRNPRNTRMPRRDRAWIRGQRWPAEAGPWNTRTPPREVRGDGVVRDGWGNGFAGLGAFL